MADVRLDEAVFRVDAAGYVERLVALIRGSQAALRRDGVLVPFSGGLDSSTVLLLCARAVGARQVTALLMPERQGNPEAEYFARRLADREGIRAVTRDISPVLSALGTYRFILSAVPTRALQMRLARAFLKYSRHSPFLDLMLGQAGGFQRGGYARYQSKQRARALVEYLVAEEENLLVVGSAHRSEDMVGLFVKFGVDDIADVMPLRNLYRSQIVQLAEHLGVPGEIMGRTPNPDIIPGVTDKYMDILGLPWNVVDLLLYGLEHGLEDGEIAGQLGLEAEKVGQMRELVERTAHMRNPPITVTWEEGGRG